MLQESIKLVLARPTIFEWQQKICNSYGNVRQRYSAFLDGRRQKILDIGCSTGAAAGGIVDMQRHDYTGIDIDPKYVEFAKNRHPLGRFLAMDARHMDFPADWFDICMFTGVLHHLDNETAVAIFKDVERVLRKDGHVLISEPVFTKGKLISNFLLSLDRGKFIRDVVGYKSLFANLKIVDEGFFPFSVHRFCSVVLQRHEGPAS